MEFVSTINLFGKWDYRSCCFSIRRRKFYCKLWKSLFRNSLKSASEIMYEIIGNWRDRFENVWYDEILWNYFQITGNHRIGWEFRRFFFYWFNTTARNSSSNEAFTHRFFQITWNHKKSFMKSDSHIKWFLEQWMNEEPPSLWSSWS